MKMLKKQTRSKATWLLGSLCKAAPLLMVVGGLQAAGTGNNQNSIVIVEPGKTLFKKSYNELIGEWSNWLQKEPIATSPAFDPNGSYCYLNQEGKIWFLAGTFGGIAERFCKVPEGKGVFFPIFANISFGPEFLNQVPCDSLEEETDQIRCDVNDDTAIAPNVGLEFLLNGEPVTDLFAYKAQSQPGGFTFQLGALFEEFGFTPGDRHPAVADGYWILLKPLPKGTHTLSFSADFDTDGIPDSGVNYTLEVIKKNN
ncbi:hypothetical protein [uncultured Photobacterium sp.]|uniref:hypothetical protein n=1 Tax=uncultured Photobacterium sp. TaxID=173973 RepID=UPI00262147C8|nr:hypothetical protein [uncultured Photobacterium sp.]